jgi:hypothetical protein
VNQRRALCWQYHEALCRCGIAEEIVDSMAEVLLPCIKTHLYSCILFGKAAPPIANTRL